MSHPHGAENSQQVIQRLRANPDIKTALGKLDKEQFEHTAAICMNSLCVEYNFISYTTSLQQLKSRMSKLPPEVEASYVQRAEQHLAAYKSAVSAADRISGMFTASGADRMLSQHGDDFFTLLRAPPHADQIRATFQQLGATNDDITHYQTWLRANGWNPLKYPGLGGTFASAVKAAQNAIPSYENQLDAVRTNGVPVIQGASPQAQSIAFGIVFVGVIVTICIVTWPLCAAHAIA
jgi:hypothetical protein